MINVKPKSSGQGKERRKSRRKLKTKLKNELSRKSRDRRWRESGSTWTSQYKEAEKYRDRTEWTSRRSGEHLSSTIVIAKVYSHGWGERVKINWVFQPYKSRQVTSQFGLIFLRRKMSTQHWSSLVMLQVNTSRVQSVQQNTSAEQQNTVGALLTYHPAWMSHHTSGSRQGHPRYTGAQQWEGRGWPDQEVSSSSTRNAKVYFSGLWAPNAQNDERERWAQTIDERRTTSLTKSAKNDFINEERRVDNSIGDESTTNNKFDEESITNYKIVEESASRASKSLDEDAVKKDEAARSAMSKRLCRVRIRGHERFLRCPVSGCPVSGCPVSGVRVRVLCPVTGVWCVVSPESSESGVGCPVSGFRSIQLHELHENRSFTKQTSKRLNFISKNIIKIQLHQIPKKGTYYATSSNKQLYQHVWWLARFARLRASRDCLVTELRVVTENHLSSTLFVFFANLVVDVWTIFFSPHVYSYECVLACFACLSACHFAPSPRGQQGRWRRALQPVLQNSKAFTPPGGVLGACGRKPLRAARSAPSTAPGPSARSPRGSRDSAGAWATDFALGWMGVGRPSWKWARFWNSAATHQLVMEERLSAHWGGPTLEEYFAILLHERPQTGELLEGRFEDLHHLRFGWLNPLLPFRVLPVLDSGHVVVVDASVHGKSAAAREKKTTNEFPVFETGVRENHSPCFAEALFVEIPLAWHIFELQREHFSALCVVVQGEGMRLFACFGGRRDRPLDGGDAREQAGLGACVRRRPRPRLRLEELARWPVWRCWCPTSVSHTGHARWWWSATRTAGPRSLRLPRNPGWPRVWRGRPAGPRRWPPALPR